MAAGELGQQGLHSGGGRFAVGVVEDQQPAGMLPQPLQHRGPLAGLVGLVLGRQAEPGGAGEGGQVALEGFGAVGVHQQQHAVGASVTPGVFKRQPGLAHATEAMEHRQCGRGVAAGGFVVEVCLELGEQGIAAEEELAQAVTGQVDRLDGRRLRGSWHRSRPGGRGEGLQKGQQVGVVVAIGEGLQPGGLPELLLEGAAFGLPAQQEVVGRHVVEGGFGPFDQAGEVGVAHGVAAANEEQRAALGQAAQHGARVGVVPHLQVGRQAEDYGLGLGVDAMQVEHGVGRGVAQHVGHRVGLPPGDGAAAGGLFDQGVVVEGGDEAAEGLHGVDQGGVLECQLADAALQPAAEDAGAAASQALGDDLSGADQHVGAT